jgi:arylsulfatase A-like enzyme
MPFIISWPGHIEGGRSDGNSEVTALDLLPTLTKMADVKLPKDYKGDGKDRSDVFLGKPSLRGKDMFWEYGRNDIAFRYPNGKDRSPNLAVRSGKWKLLMNNDGSDVQLYDITKDKNETENLASQNTKIVQELKEKLRNWWNEMPKL